METEYRHFEKATLKEHVKNWIEDAAKERDGDTQGVIDDLFQGGCQSGMVGHLIYYTDTVAFYEQYQKEIDAMLKELIWSTGLSPDKLFAHIGWDESDPLAREATNKNILAWLGFEEMARQVAEGMGLDT